MPQNHVALHDWKTPPKDWAEEQALRMARGIRMLRGKRSAQWLADRTKELGYTVTRSVISDLELGRRRYVSTAEIVILARALTVPPACLLYPDLPDGPVEVLPGTQVRSIDAAMWFSGELIYQPSPSDPTPKAYLVHDGLLASAIARRTQLSRERVELRKRIAVLTDLAKWLQATGDVSSTQAGTVTAEISRIWKELNEIVAELQAVRGFVVADTAEEERFGR